MKSIILLILLVPCLVFANNESAKQLKIKKLSDNVYQHISFKRVEPWGLVEASGLVVINGAEVHMIDTPWTTQGTKELIKWIEAQGLTLKNTVVTHFHEDASGDLAFLNDLKIKTYATSLTNKRLKSNRKETSSDEISTNTFELADGVVSIFYPGAGHTEDNIVVWLPKEKILFGGCFVRSLHAKSLGNTGDAVIDEWSNSIQKVINRYPDIKLVVPGHGKVGDASLLTHTQKLALSAKDSNKKL
ncbi:VMB family subclass B1 metallo-beta-lactamase [Thalassomonas haliotis]|uniref:beta-lactamase n=1 Tax=Thalassomonas haliotis TaxID=485448 RepID=A0ABY7VAR0_9GAMM|nr:VMB family subclass B1 metallo-beta-lactamase [Thalassomonas haliotis]WDE10164.1 subclass B1 metallo-beta-lactamase [Thalassomonas haliotis]